MAHEKMDFNDARRQGPDQRKKIDVVLLKERMADCYRQILDHLLPNGVYVGEEFHCGDIYGAPGESLKLSVRKNKMGVGEDFATGQKFGDLIDVWQIVRREDYTTAVRNIAEFLNMAERLPAPVSKTAKSKAPEIGAPVAQYNYTDAQGTILLVVYRHEFDDNGKRKKTFRIWNAVTHKSEAPISGRPLYKQPDIAKADVVVLAEGEKAADALIAADIPATSAVCGSNAPTDKTDWSPLAGKRVLIWPDNDLPGLSYAQKAAQAALAAGALSVGILPIPQGKPGGWDAADAVAEGMDVRAYVDAAMPEPVVPPAAATIPAYPVGAILDDDSPMPDDLIAPRILTPGGLAVFGGAPKVGKSDFLFSLLVHAAAGRPFLGMTPPRPLNVFCLQTEIGYHYLRERLKQMKIDPEILPLVRKNLVITPQVRLILDDKGVEMVRETILRHFDPKLLDIIAIDPLRNVFDAGEGTGENDNTSMLNFLQERVEKLRFLVNPDAGVILAHHTRKITKRMLEEDPFQALSGAGSLRSFYTTGVIMFRPDENQTLRELMFELRNGKAIPSKYVDKINGIWREVEHQSKRLVNKEHGERLDNERRRRHDVILQLIYDEGLRRHLYSPTQFCQAFENKAGLGGFHSIRERIDVLTTKGFIKFNKEDRSIKTKYGMMCVEGMEVPRAEPDVDPQTGEIMDVMLSYLPTHFKQPTDGAILPVENPEVWIYHEGVEP
jgi:hypothetical protein